MVREFNFIITAFIIIVLIIIIYIEIICNYAKLNLFLCGCFLNFLYVYMYCIFLDKNTHHVTFTQGSYFEPYQSEINSRRANKPINMQIVHILHIRTKPGGSDTAIKV